MEDVNKEILIMQRLLMSTVMTFFVIMGMLIHFLEKEQLSNIGSSASSIGWFFALIGVIFALINFVFLKRNKITAMLLGISGGFIIIGLFFLVAIFLGTHPA